MKLKRIILEQNEEWVQVTNAKEWKEKKDMPGCKTKNESGKFYYDKNTCSQNQLQNTPSYKAWTILKDENNYKDKSKIFPSVASYDDFVKEYLSTSEKCVKFHNTLRETLNSKGKPFCVRTIDEFKKTYCSDLDWYKKEQEKKPEVNQGEGGNKENQGNQPDGKTEEKPRIKSADQGEIDNFKKKYTCIDVERWKSVYSKILDDYETVGISRDGADFLYYYMSGTVLKLDTEGNVIRRGKFSCEE